MRLKLPIDPIGIFKKASVYKKKPETSLRIASFNVHYGRQPEKISGAILANKNLIQADVLLLQEIEQRPTAMNARTMAELLGMGYVYFPSRHDRFNSHGLAILSKFPFMGESSTLQLHKFDFPFRARSRIAVKATIDVNGAPVNIYNVHLDTRINFRERVLQLDAVMKDIGQYPEEKVVLAGDLNTLPIHWVKNTLPVFYSNQKKKMYKFFTKQKFISLPLNLGATMDMRHSLLRFQLDCIYAKGFILKNHGIEKKVRVSDHFPVWADLEAVKTV